MGPKQSTPCSSSTLADSVHLSAPDSWVPTPEHTYIHMYVHICTYMHIVVCSLKAPVRVVGVRVLFNITAC